jgi:hypothetical protein
MLDVMRNASAAEELEGEGCFLSCRWKVMGTRVLKLQVAFSFRDGKVSDGTCRDDMVAGKEL